MKLRNGGGRWNAKGFAGAGQAQPPAGRGGRIFPVPGAGPERHRRRGHHGGRRLTHGGFYGQFTNKDALAAEAFDAAIGNEYRADLETFIENYLSTGHVRTPGKGCPVAALASDIGREPAGSALRSRFTHAVKGLAGLIADRLPKSSKERRRQRSLIALSTMVGAVVLARGVDDEALADELLACARTAITT